MHPTKLTTALVVLFVCVTGVAVGVPTGQSPSSPQSQQAQRTVHNPNATVVFTNQTSNGTTVRINSVNLSQGGFVAIHNESLTENNSTVSSVVGVSDRLSSGPHQDVTVHLYAVDGREFNQSELSKNGTLTAVAHFDSNGNGEFDFVQSNGSVDGPYVEGTQVVTESANVSVEQQQNQTITDRGFLGNLNPLVILGVVVVIVLIVLALLVASRR